MIKILIVDDHPIFIDGLKTILSSHFPRLKVLQASNVVDAIEILDSHHVDLVLLDFRMPELDGMDFLNAYNERGNRSPVAMVSSETSPQIVLQALNNGATGFLPKSLEPQEFLLAIQFVLQGKQYLTRSMKLKIDKFKKSGSQQESKLTPADNRDLAKAVKQYGFTRRQGEVLNLMHKGCTNKDISSVLHISVSTVKEHIHNIFRLMDVGTRGQCIAKLYDFSE